MINNYILNIVAPQRFLSLSVSEREVKIDQIEKNDVPKRCFVFYCVQNSELTAFINKVLCYL